jgi:hypothetical protein
LLANLRKKNVLLAPAEALADPAALAFLRLTDASALILTGGVRKHVWCTQLALWDVPRLQRSGPVCSVC